MTKNKQGLIYYQGDALAGLPSMTFTFDIPNFEDISKSEHNDFIDAIKKAYDIICDSSGVFGE